MKFIDEVVVQVRSGDGGAGCVSFRRERFLPKGGPDGGDGGDGGSVILRADASVATLADLVSSPSIKAPHGKPGKGRDQTGRSGTDRIVKVPIGTTVYDAETGQFLGDLVQEGQEFLAARGGRGGKGNRHFASATHRTPRFAQPGTRGETRTLRLSLRSLAEVGLVGFPNAGKSTLLSRLTSSRPRVGAYPFTTVTPNLGVMDREERHPMIIADIPGLIHGAAEGRGLGHRFLKHIERTGLLLFLLDITYRPRQDLLEDFHQLRRELEAYDPALTSKPSLVAINKVDLAGPEARPLDRLMERLVALGQEVYAISALTGQGLDKLKEGISRRWP